ncbi:MAG: sigma-70 family RNA polymerase sigma factor [Bacteroidales bacterium]
MSRKIKNDKLLDGIRRQDEQILEWIYSNWIPMVRHHIHRNSGSDDDVWDVFQDSIVVLFEKVNEKEFNLTTDLKGFFFGIARNVWNYHRRKKSKETDINCDLVANIVNEEVVDYILERIFTRSFEKLKSDSKQVLNLYSEGLSYTEIAKRMNLTSETYARRKKYLSKQELISIIKKDPEYKDYLDQ